MGAVSYRLPTLEGENTHPEATVSAGGGGVLDDRDHAIGHEPACPDHLAAPGDLGYLDDASPGGHLDPPAGAGGLDLEPLNPAAGIDHDLDTVASHSVHPRPGRRHHGGFTRRQVWFILTRARFEDSRKGASMRKFLILLGVIGLVIAVTMYVRNRQNETEF
jgi:hypothetical protein